MTGFIRSLQSQSVTWRGEPIPVTHSVDIADYELILEQGLNEDGGSVTIAGKLDFDPTGMALYVPSLCGDVPFQVSSQSNSNETSTTLSLMDFTAPADGLYDGSEPWGNSFSYWLDIIFQFRSIIAAKEGMDIYSSAGWSDSIWRTALGDYLDNHVPALEDLQEEERYFSKGKILRWLRSVGVSLNPNTASGSLIMAPELEEISDPVSIVFGDGHSYLISEEFNDDIVSRAVVNEIQYYLAEDGTVFDRSQWLNHDYDQIRGRSVARYDASLNTDEKRIAAAQEIFNENKREHKIVFLSDKKLHFRQPVRLKLSRFILDTVITTVRVKSSDNRYEYTCGELPGTLSEIIKSNRWSYNRRLPTAPRKGQLVLI